MALSILEDINLRILSLLTYPELVNYSLVSTHGHRLANLAAKNKVDKDFWPMDIPRDWYPLLWYRYVEKNHHCYSLDVGWKGFDTQGYFSSIGKLRSYLENLVPGVSLDTLPVRKRFCLVIHKCPINGQSEYLDGMINCSLVPPDERSLTQMLSSIDLPSISVPLPTLYEVKFCQTCKDKCFDAETHLISEDKINHYYQLQHQYIHMSIRQITMNYSLQE